MAKACSSVDMYVYYQILGAETADYSTKGMLVRCSVTISVSTFAKKEFIEYLQTATPLSTYY
jgi:hypothetical protein